MRFWNSRHGNNWVRRGLKFGAIGFGLFATGMFLAVGNSIDTPGQGTLIDATPRYAAALPENSVSSVVDGRYTNPIGGPLNMGDPFVLVDAHRLFLYGTTAVNEGFKCWSSTNFLDWTDWPDPIAPAIAAWFLI